MENLSITGLDYIPRVNMDVETGVLNIEGESYHEYTLEFFEPIFNWLREYTKTPEKKIELNFRMSYFNTSSSRRFLEIMNLLEEYEKEKNGRVTVNWYYEKNDLDMLESGEEYAEDVKLEFNLIAY
ncbi:MAG: DUF1987 domain-containing protein [Bacteroidetes bacterium]|nr:MAG: DUF1987 domain-containing protein [Bacteroidota bacterium]TAG90440.1 MAG: DUF1987 domain-containing protein [Bacteroidota bacterium]